LVAAAEVTSSSAKVIVVQARHMIGAKATDAISTETADATSVKAADMTCTEAAHLASTEAIHVTSAEAAHTATVSSTPSATAARLCTRGKKAAGKHCACQNHHHSSSHDILHLRWADVLPGFSDIGPSQRDNANVAMNWRWECLFVVSTKFAFIRLRVSRALSRRQRSPDRHPSFERREYATKLWF
jgi:hypothetical protein